MFRRFVSNRLLPFAAQQPIIAAQQGQKTSIRLLKTSQSLILRSMLPAYDEHGIVMEGSTVLISGHRISDVTFENMDRKYSRVEDAVNRVYGYVCNDENVKEKVFSLDDYNKEVDRRIAGSLPYTIVSGIISPMLIPVVPTPMLMLMPFIGPCLSRVATDPSTIIDAEKKVQDSDLNKGMLAVGFSSVGVMTCCLDMINCLNPIFLTSSTLWITSTILTGRWLQQYVSINSNIDDVVDEEKHKKREKLIGSLLGFGAGAGLVGLGSVYMFPHAPLETWASLLFIYSSTSLVISPLFYSHNVEKGKMNQAYNAIDTIGNASLLMLSTSVLYM